MNTQKISQTKIEQTTLDKEVYYEKKGVKVHLAVTAAVSGLLATINMLTVPQFAWFIFPTVGMSVGIIIHYFGLRLHCKKIQS